MPRTVHTPTELRDVLVTIIVGVAGGNAEEWCSAIGDIEKLPIATNVRSNWRVRPTGSKAQQGVIRRAVKVVRAAHPYVAG